MTEPSGINRAVLPDERRPAKGASVTVGIISVILACVQPFWPFCVGMIAYAFMGGDDGPQKTGIGGSIFAVIIMAAPSFAAIMLGIIAVKMRRAFTGPGAWGIIIAAIWLVPLVGGIVQWYVRGH